MKPNPEISRDIEIALSKQIESPRNKFGVLPRVGLFFVVASNMLIAACSAPNATASGPLQEVQTPEIIYLKDQVKEILLTDQPSIERQRYQTEIEQKYGIELLTMQQAFKYMGREYNPLDSSKIPVSPPSRWGSDQLKLYDEIFSFMPKSLYEPINGVNFKLFEASLAGTDCGACGGASFGHGVINITQTRDRVLAFSMLIHEATHRLDNLTGLSVRAGVKGILGDRLSELHAKQDFILANTKPNSLEQVIILSLVDTDIDKPQIGGSDSQNHMQINEGVAELSQAYINGYEKFMLALGPILDGHGESVMQVDPAINLAENFPMTQGLYDFYRKNVFKGDEFDKDKIELINLGKELVSQRALDKQALSNLIKAIGQDFGVKIEVDESNISAGFLGESKLRRLLAAFPRDFYSTSAGEKVSIHFINGLWEGREFSFSGSLDRIDLNMENYFSPVSRTVTITGQPSRTILSPIDILANDLVRRKDEAIGYQTRNSITGILGGEVFLNSPETLYPELSKIRGPLDPYAGEVYSMFYSGDLPSQKSVRDSSEIVGRFGVLYTRGWKIFSESLGPIIGFAKTSELYNQMQKLYSGVEFSDSKSLDGILTRLPTS